MCVCVCIHTTLQSLNVGTVPEVLTPDIVSVCVRPRWPQSVLERDRKPVNDEVCVCVREETKRYEHVTDHEFSLCC